MAELKWGVWFEGSSVTEVADGLSAFRVERAMRACGYADALVVWSPDGARWYPVSRESVFRPDPEPPKPTWRPQKWPVRGWLGKMGVWASVRCLGAERMPVPGGWWRRVRR